jgi:hypothetical protein
MEDRTEFGPPKCAIQKQRASLRSVIATRLGSQLSGKGQRTMTRIWCEDYSDETYTDAKVDNPRRFLGIPLTAGRPVGDRFPEGTLVVVRSSAPPTDFFMAGMMPVVSQKLKTLLDKHGVRAEFIPVGLRHGSGQESQSRFYCFNLLSALDCLDKHQSVFAADRGFALDIERLVLVPTRPEEPPVYFIANAIPSIVCARDDVADEIERSGCTGIVFRTPEQWKNPTNPV